MSADAPGFRMPELSLRVIHVWRRNMEVWRTYIYSSLVGNFLDPVFMLIGLGLGLGGFIGKIGEISYIQYLAPGMVASTAMYTAAFEGTFSAYTRMGPQRTYESIIMTPVNIEEVVLGEILWGATKAMISSCAILLIMLILGLVKSPMAVLVIPSVFVIGIMFSSMALLFTSISPSYEFFSYFFTLVLTPMFILSGIFFPLEVLPEWLLPVAWMLPLTHSAAMTRGLIMGDFSALMLLLNIAWMLIFATVAFLMASWKIRRRIIV